MHQPGSASAEAHRARVLRGVTAVEVYLQAQFPGHNVETLHEVKVDIARSVRTFRIRKDTQRYLLRVVDEVLDLDTEGAISHLRRFQVARTIREEGVGKIVVVKTHEVTVEST